MCGRMRLCEPNLVPIMSMKGGEIRLHSIRLKSKGPLVCNNDFPIFGSCCEHETFLFMAIKSKPLRE